MNNSRLFPPGWRIEVDIKIITKDGIISRAGTDIASARIPINIGKVQTTCQAAIVQAFDKAFKNLEEGTIQ